MSADEQSNPSTDYSLWSADETIAAIKNKSVTAREYISSVLDGAEKTKSLNAFINILSDSALSAADNVDRAVAAGNPPPLAGLAIVVKDNINFAGFPTTAGTAALQHNRPPTTAPSLEKLIAAGAIVVGKTNMHELSFGPTSTNLQPFANPVRNPYDKERIPGGSSGGTAAAVAARVVTCGLGSDTTGSVRFPAALSGVVGFRPSVGNGGAQRRYKDDERTVVPISPTCDTVGPMGRSVAEIALLDSIITGRARVNATELHGVRLGVPAILWSGLDEEVEKISLNAVKKLQDAGIALVQDDIPNLRSLNDAIGMVILSHETPSAISTYLNASNVTGIDLKNIFDGIASPDVKALFKGILNGTVNDEYAEVIRTKRPALQKLYADYFTQNRVDALIFPTTILPATLIDLEHGTGNVSINGKPPIPTVEAYNKNTWPGGSAGLPGLSIPVGSTSNDLPIGIEIDGPVGSDERLISIGLAIEKIFGALPAPKQF